VPAAPGDRLGGGRLRDPEQDGQAVAPQLIDHGRAGAQSGAQRAAEVKPGGVAFGLVEVTRSGEHRDDPDRDVDLIPRGVF
jgi:hypothetical protein